MRRYVFDSLPVSGAPVKKKLVRLIKNIYTDRKFTVFDAGQHSEVRAQSTGISQGCPLSPYLFLIVMTVIFKDVMSKDIGVLVTRHNVMSDWEDSEPVWAWDIYGLDPVPITPIEIKCILKLVYLV